MPDHPRELSVADLDSLSDLETPWCVRILVTLCIAEHIEAGVTTIEALAAASAADAGSLLRVLRHAVGKGLLVEPAPGRFELNEAARALLEPSARLGLGLDGIGGRMAYVWSSLLPAVRTGAPAYHEVFGRPFWEDLAAHPDVAASFDALMGPAGHGPPDPSVLVNDDWDAVQSVVDVGGGSGSLLVEILRRHPSLRGTLVDLPSTVARAQATLEATGVSDRVTTVGQSFFDVLPGGADLYLLQNVLADWSDKEAGLLLRRCADAARPNGRLVLVGGVSIAEDAVPAPELLMMVLVGGKARSLPEFRALAGSVGLDVTVVGRQRGGRTLVECRPL